VAFYVLLDHRWSNFDKDDLQIQSSTSSIYYSPFEKNWERISCKSSKFDLKYHSASSPRMQCLLNLMISDLEKRVRLFIARL